MAEEKKITGIDEIEAGFVSEPEVDPISKVEIDSFTAGPAEIKEDLKAAGIDMMQEEKAAVPAEETAIGIEKTAFDAVPELSPIEQLEVDEYVASDAEIKKDMKDAGLEVAEAAAKEAVPLAETAIGLEKTGFTDIPELTPIEQIGVDELVASPQEVEDDIKKAGLK